MHDVSIGSFGLWGVNGYGNIFKRELSDNGKHGK